MCTHTLTHVLSLSYFASHRDGMSTARYWCMFCSVHVLIFTRNVQSSRIAKHISYVVVFLKDKDRKTCHMLKGNCNMHLQYLRDKHLPHCKLRKAEGVCRRRFLLVCEKEWGMSSLLGQAEPEMIWYTEHLWYDQNALQCHDELSVNMNRRQWRVVAHTVLWYEDKVISANMSLSYIISFPLVFYLTAACAICLMRKNNKSHLLTS